MSKSHGQTVLVLGAGLVARPLVHYLSGKGFRVIVGSRTLEAIDKLSRVPNTPRLVNLTLKVIRI